MKTREKIGPGEYRFTDEDGTVWIVTKSGGGWWAETTDYRPAYFPNNFPGSGFRCRLNKLSDMGEYRTIKKGER